MLNKTKAALQSCQCHYQMFKQEQNTRVSAGGQSLSQRNPYVQINRVRLTYGHRYPLNNFNYREMRELANTLIIPKNANGAVRLPQIEALEEINNLVPESHLVHGSSTIGGWVSEAFLYHEENHNVAVLHRNPDLAYERVVPQSHEVNRVVTHSYQVNRVAKRYAESKTSLRGAVQCVETYEIFVGHSITESNPVQPFGSMPRLFNSALPNSFSQLARLTPSCLASLSNCSFNSGGMRIWNAGALPVPLGCLSRLMIVDMCVPIAVVFFQIGTHLTTMLSIKTTPPNGITSTERGLTTTVSESNEAAMKDHITHPQGRKSYIWRFLALSAIGRNVIHITATTEREAREQSPAGCVMVFAGRLPVEDSHA